ALRRTGDRLFECDEDRIAVDDRLQSATLASWGEDEARIGVGVWRKKIVAGLRVRQAGRLLRQVERDQSRRDGRQLGELRSGEVPDVVNGERRLAVVGGRGDLLDLVEREQRAVE